MRWFGVRPSSEESHIRLCFMRQRAGAAPALMAFQCSEYDSRFAEIKIGWLALMIEGKGAGDWK